MLRKNTGFTFIEVLVAMVVLSIGLLGLVALITGVINGNKVSNRITTATVLAQDKMEKIKGVGYYDAEDEAGTEDYGEILWNSSYKRITGIVVDDPETGMKKITVTVYWDSDAHSLELKTILAE